MCIVTLCNFAVSSIWTWCPLSKCPQAFRDWDVELYDWQTTCSTLAKADEQGSLSNTCRCMMPTGGQMISFCSCKCVCACVNACAYMYLCTSVLNMRTCVHRRVTLYDQCTVDKMWAWQVLIRAADAKWPLCIGYKLSFLVIKLKGRCVQWLLMGQTCPKSVLHALCDRTRWGTFPMLQGDVFYGHVPNAAACSRKCVMLMQMVASVPDTWISRVVYLCQRNARTQHFASLAVSAPSYTWPGNSVS